jgi:hypothetical protein
MDIKPSDINDDFWNYLSQGQRDLILQGQYLLKHFHNNRSIIFNDYSFIIFPFAKAYEGYLKQLFLDLGFITHLDYISDHYRLGKMMSPHLMGRIGERSLYKHILQFGNEELANTIWQTWKEGRNKIFHYFPHNLRAVSFSEADSLVHQLMSTMQVSYDTLLKPNKDNLKPSAAINQAA